jgi:hypothetical protein
MLRVKSVRSHSDSAGCTIITLEYEPSNGLEIDAEAVKRVLSRRLMEFLFCSIGQCEARV